MATHQISLNIASNSNDSVDTPQYVSIEFTDEQLHRIRKHVQYSIRHGVEVSMPHGDIEYFDDETIESDFRSDVEDIRISGNRCYYYAQSKYDSSVQIESEPFSVILKNKQFSFDYTH
jgi:hypothetical protein